MGSTPEFSDIHDFLNALTFRKAAVGANEEDVYACIQDIDAMYKDKLIEVNDYYQAGIKDMKKRLAASENISGQLKGKLVEAKRLYDAQQAKLASLQKSRVPDAHKEEGRVIATFGDETQSDEADEPSEAEEAAAISAAVHTEKATSAAAVSAAHKTVASPKTEQQSQQPLALGEIETQRAELLERTQQELDKQLKEERAAARAAALQEMQAYAQELVTQACEEADAKAQAIYEAACKEAAEIRAHSVALAQQAQAAEEAKQQEAAALEARQRAEEAALKAQEEAERLERLTWSKRGKQEAQQELGSLQSELASLNEQMSAMQEKIQQMHLTAQPETAIAPVMNTAAGLAPPQVAQQSPAQRSADSEEQGSGEWKIDREKLTRFLNKRRNSSGDR